MRGGLFTFLIGLASLGCSAQSRAPAQQPAATPVRTFVIESDILARLTVDVPMKLQGPEGPTIGFLRRGTAPYVLHSEGNRVWLDARFPAVSRTGELRGPWQETGLADGVRVVIESRISPATGAAVTPNAAAHEDIRWGLHREISVARGGPGFAFVRCGRFRVLERQGDDMRIAAEYGAGELHGWVKAAAPFERDEGCEVSLSPALPLGYVQAYGKPEEVLRLAAQPRQLSIIRRENGAFVCQSWQLAPSGHADRGRLVAPQPKTKGPGLAFSEWQYGIDGLVLAITPLYAHEDGGKWTSSAMRFLAVVRTASDAIDVIETGAPEGSDRLELVGYRKSAAQRWYFSASACEADAQYLPHTTSGASLPNYLAPP